MIKDMKFIFLALCLTLGPLSLHAGNWPAWRGPHGDGRCDEVGLPLHWSATENIAWAVELPERGNSTPVIWGDRVFITQAVQKENRRLVLCFDRRTGMKMWEAGTTYKEAEATHGTNPYCSGSPVTDGQRVVVNFASAGVFCYDMAGQELWHRELGKLHHIWGNGASPVLANGLCYLNVGPSEKVRLLAMDPKTGATVWEHEEPRQPVLSGQADYYGSWSDPLARVIDGQPQLLMSWPGRVCALQAMTGKEIWTCQGLNQLVYTSPLLADGIVVSLGGYNGMAVAVKTGGLGDVTATQRLWHHPKSPQRIGSGVIHGGHIFILNDPGLAQCFNLKTGALVWQERLKGPGPTGQNWSSLVVSEGRCYAVNQGGDAFVFRASPTFELLATNAMNEMVIGSIAVADGQLFIRGYKHLFCVGRK
jgi:outer membrane protein assembly factor BamB